MLPDQFVNTEPVRSADPPIISKTDSDADPIMTIALSANRPVRELTELADKVIKEQLERSTGVGEIRINGGLQRTINIGLLDADGAPAGPGDWVLIHVGFAISQIDEDEALATRRLLEEMGAEYEQELRELQESVIE